MYKKILIPLLFLSVFVQAQQKPMLFEAQSWASYNLQAKFSSKWGSWFDAEIHTKDHYFNEFSQVTIRLGASYYLKNHNKIIGGYGYTDYFPTEGHQYISIPEHFVWQQYQFFHNSQRHKLMQWIRLEEKWKGEALNDYTHSNNYTFYYKFRYNLFYQIPLHKKGFVPKSLSIALSDELYLYYGPTLANHVLDQNRVFAGFSYAVNPHDNLVFGVLNILQQNTAGTQFKNTNVLRVSFFENLGLK